MPILWEWLEEGFVLEKGSDVNRAVVHLYTNDITKSADQTKYTTDELLDSIPFNINDAYPDPDLPGATLKVKRLLGAPRDGKARVQLLFDSSIRFGGAPRNGLETYYQTEPYTVYPQAHRYQTTLQGAPLYNIKMVEGAHRCVILQYQTKYISNSNEGEIQTAAAQSIGKGYVIKGIPTILMGVDTQTRTGGLMLVRYRFRSEAPLKGLQGTRARELGFALDLPDLDYLQKWVPVKDPTTGLYTSIDVLLRTDLYEDGLPLP